MQMTKTGAYRPEDGPEKLDVCGEKDRMGEEQACCVIVDCNCYY